VRSTGCARRWTTILERELRELQVEWPATPDIAGSLRLEPPPRRSFLFARPAWQLAVAVLALVLAVVMAVPSTRAEVLDVLGFSSVRIEHREPAPSRFGAAVALGDPVSLEQARRRAGFPLRVPAALGRPDGVFLAAQPARVDMTYRPRPGLPASGTTGVGLLVTELRAAATPVIEKTLGAASKSERLTVGGDPAFFISGARHGFAYVPSGTGEPLFEEQRLAGNTLLVERGDGVLVRIEGEVSRDKAARIAASLR
jgi:hypothetical protein